MIFWFHMIKGSIGFVSLNAPRVESELPSVYHVVMASPSTEKNLIACLSSHLVYASWSPNWICLKIGWLISYFQMKRNWYTGLGMILMHFLIAVVTQMEYIKSSVYIWSEEAWVLLLGDSVPVPSICETLITEEPYLLALMLLQVIGTVEYVSNLVNNNNNNSHLHNMILV